MDRATQTFVTIVDPRIKTATARSGTIHDYIQVPRLATHGTWRVLDMLSYPSMRNMLTAYNRSKRNQKH